MSIGLGLKMDASHARPVQSSVPTGVGTLVLHGKGGTLSVFKRSCGQAADSTIHEDHLRTILDNTYVNAMRRRTSPVRWSFEEFISCYLPASTSQICRSSVDLRVRYQHWTCEVLRMQRGAENG